MLKQWFILVFLVVSLWRKPTVNRWLFVFSLLSVTTVVGVSVNSVSGWKFNTHTKQTPNTHTHTGPQLYSSSTIKTNTGPGHMVTWSAHGFVDWMDVFSAVTQPVQCVWRLLAQIGVDPSVVAQIRCWVCTDFPQGRCSRLAQQCELQRQHGPEGETSETLVIDGCSSCPLVGRGSLHVHRTMTYTRWRTPLGEQSQVFTVLQKWCSDS